MGFGSPGIFPIGSEVLPLDPIVFLDLFKLFAEVGSVYFATALLSSILILAVYGWNHLLCSNVFIVQFILGVFVLDEKSCTKKLSVGGRCYGRVAILFRFPNTYMVLERTFDEDTLVTWISRLTERTIELQPGEGSRHPWPQLLGYPCG